VTGLRYGDPGADDHAEHEQHHDGERVRQLHLGVNGTTYTQSGTYTNVTGLRYGDLGADDPAER
jgi:hypothetical protein